MPRRGSSSRGSFEAGHGNTWRSPAGVRQARLAVGVARTLAVFVLETWQAGSEDRVPRLSRWSSHCFRSHAAKFEFNLDRARAIPVRRRVAPSRRTRVGRACRGEGARRRTGARRGRRTARAAPLADSAPRADAPMNSPDAYRMRHRAREGNRHDPPVPTRDTLFGLRAAARRPFGRLLPDVRG